MIRLNHIHKTYQMGETLVRALDDVSLEIGESEFIAIMGPSGSGKSTLMHILGLLDTPDKGSYELNGKNISHLSEDELALHRRKSIGFVFQQFNLLPRMTALENVAMPLLYSQHQLDKEKSLKLLQRVGLGERTLHKTNELSGGQQQRVAIARALVNNPGMILADEPTGNLDSASEKEILGIFKSLHESGMTIIIVTHEEEIAEFADRIIRMRDGKILSDEKKTVVKKKTLPVVPKASFSGRAEQKDKEFYPEVLSYILQGIKILAANKVRTALSVLGILIGVAAVVAMLAIGKGAQKSIETQLASLGSNLLSLRTGAARSGGVAQEAGLVTRMTLEDIKNIEKQISTVKQVAPMVNGRGQITYKNQNWNTQILGVTPAYAAMRAATPAVGRFFTRSENAQRKRVAVIGKTIAREVFLNNNPVGEMIKINKIPFLVIGILPAKGANTFRDQDDVIAVPVSTAMYRLLGKNYIDSIDIEVRQASEIPATEDAILKLMLENHNVPPSQSAEAFQIRNMADIQETLSQTSNTMAALLAAIAAISLLVGGIGIMNIMLVSVTERTREIGLRKAVGARQKDILLQFIAESVVISILGGVGGIVSGILITIGIATIAGWAVFVSVTSVLLAFCFSASIGLIFGIYPARKASMQTPIEALRYE